MIITLSRRSVSLSLQHHRALVRQRSAQLQASTARVELMGWRLVPAPSIPSLTIAMSSA